MISKLNKKLSDYPALIRLDNAFQRASYDVSRNLEGRILTIIDASFTDREQREAMKSLIRQAIHGDNYFPISGIIRQFSIKFAGQMIEPLEEGKDSFSGNRLPIANYFEE